MPLEILPAQDATLWWVQDGGSPLLIGALCVFEGAPLRDEAGNLDIDRLRRHVTARLGDAPRFYKRLVRLPIDQGLAWCDDEHFDIAHHVRSDVLPAPGGDAELRGYVARLLEEPLDPARPLWEIRVVDGLAGDRVAIVPRANHVLVDGMALLGLALSLLDVEPRPPGDEPVDWEPEPLPDPPSLLVSSLLGRSGHQARALWRLASSAVDPRVLLGAVGSVARLARSGAGRAPALPITQAVGARRDFVWVRLPWSDLDRVKRAEGTTLNDVVLSICAGALDHYLTRAGGGPGDEPPRVLVPVSTHGASAADEVENRFSVMVADVPAGVADPLERLRSVHGEMERHKQSSQTVLGPVLFSIGDLVPPWLLRRLGPMVLRRQPFVNLAVSDLPGTRDPLYLLGSRMVELFPFIGGVGNLAVIIGVLSYEDTLGVGITVDADVVPDVDVLAEGMALACRELVDAVGP